MAVQRLVCAVLGPFCLQRVLLVFESSFSCDVRTSRAALGQWTSFDEARYTDKGGGGERPHVKCRSPVKTRVCSEKWNQVKEKRYEPAGQFWSPLVVDASSQLRWRGRGFGNISVVDVKRCSLLKVPSCDGVKVISLECVGTENCVLGGENSSEMSRRQGTTSFGFVMPSLTFFFFWRWHNLILWSLLN